MGLKLFRESPKKAFLQELRGPKKKGKSMPVWLFTIYYLIGVGAIIFGVKTGPFQGSREPILPSELAENIPIFIFFYFLILGCLKLSDYLNSRRK
jgi:hypothetical protein